MVLPFKALIDTHKEITAADLEDWSLLNLISNIKNLKDLRISATCNTDFFHHLETWSGLEKLTLRDCMLTDDHINTILPLISSCVWLDVSENQIQGHPYLNFRTDDTTRSLYFIDKEKRLRMSINTLLTNGNLLLVNVARHLLSLTCVQTLKVSNCYHLVEDIAVQVEKTCDFQSLCLYRWNPSRTYLESWGRFYPRLEVLSLIGCNIDNESCFLLAKISSLKTLNLPDNLFDQYGLYGLLENPSLTELDISRNDISSIGLEYLSKNVSITKLNISRITKFYDGPITFELSSSLRALVTNTSVQYLTLGSFSDYLHWLPILTNSCNLLGLYFNVYYDWPTFFSQSEIDAMQHRNATLLHNWCYASLIITFVRANNHTSLTSSVIPLLPLVLNYLPFTRTEKFRLMNVSAFFDTQYCKNCSRATPPKHHRKRKKIETI